MFVAAISILVALNAVRASPLASLKLVERDGTDLGHTSMTNCFDLQMLGTETGSIIAYGKSPECNANQGKDNHGNSISTEGPGTFGQLANARPSPPSNPEVPSNHITCQDLVNMGMDTSCYFNSSNQTLCSSDMYGSKRSDIGLKISNLDCQDLEALGIDTSKHPEYQCSIKTPKRTAYRVDQGSDKPTPTPSDSLKPYMSTMTYGDMKSLGFASAFNDGMSEPGNYASCYDLEMFGMDTDYKFPFLQTSMCHYPAGFTKASSWVRQ